MLLVKYKSKKKIILSIVIVFNILLLFYYKYLDFTIANFNLIFKEQLPLQNIALPIGISFFTFQALSYCVDVYRDERLLQKNPLNIALYISFFPQLIAGPIVRFTTISQQIEQRKESLNGFSNGVDRFIYGLAKKVIFANVLAVFVDDIFSADLSTMAAVTAWVGAIGYTLQIYYDFSGYSDMAIGLGRMFGFEFDENFNYPYISNSISEFWRRWHISLSTWFKDYIYIPLGGNRVSQLKLYRNIMAVWLLTGVWHGANWTFICWGIVYGILIMGEKVLKFEKWNIPIILKKTYTLVTVIFLWVVFRSDSLKMAKEFVCAMLGVNKAGIIDAVSIFYVKENSIILLLAIFFATPFSTKVLKREGATCGKQMVQTLIMAVIFIISVSYIVKGAYNPFIYFNF